MLMLDDLPAQVDLPVDKGVVLLDVAFTGTDPNHGETGGGFRQMQAWLTK